MRRLLALSIVLIPILAATCAAQVAPPPSPSQPTLSADEAREIWDTGFRQKRPSGTHPSATAAQYTPSARSHTSTHSSSKPSEAAVGFTIWRLRPPDANDRDGARILVQDLGSQTNLVPERVDDATPLHVGERIRLSLEVPRAGFLYVIDRERYSDGSTGDPVLIFPTLNMNGGNNEVVPGRVIEIPPQNGPVRALRIARSSNLQVAEDLIVIVAPQPLSDLHPTEGAQPLSASQVSAWDRDWTTTSAVFNLQGGQRQVWSATEQKAGQSPASSLLTQADPMPQTIVSVVPQGKSLPLLVHLPLEIQ